MNLRKYRHFPQLLLACTLLPSLTAQAETACQAPADTDSRWYWYTKDELGDVQNCHMGAGCDGLYIPPVANWLDHELPVDVAPVHATADRSRLQGSEVFLEGYVVIYKGELRVSAGEARFDRDTEKLFLSDDVTILLPDTLLRGERAEITSTSGTGQMEQAEYLSFKSGARGTADLVVRESETVTRLEGAEYTQCPPTSNVWRLNADRVKLDFESGRGVARDSSLRIKGVPVFYTPWIDFPLDERRATGFLWPSFAQNENGLDISAPYYFNLAPNYDLTLTPRLVGDRGGMLESEARYLNRWSFWRLSSAWIDDQQADTDRWLVNLGEGGNINEQWSTSIDYSKASDKDYFDDLSVSSLSVKRSTHLSQRAQVNYASQHWQSQLIVHKYQTLANVSNPYQKLPQWTLAYRPVVSNIRLEPFFKSDITLFDHQDSTADGGLNITGQRTYGEAGLRLPLVGRTGHLIGTTKLRYLGYQLDNGVQDTSPEVASELVSLDGELVFERSTRKWQQTLEPRLYYLYGGNEDKQSSQPLFDTSLRPLTYEQLFRDSRFAGYDRLADANQLSIGLRTSFFDNEKGLEVLSMAVGQILYFKDRRVNLPTSLVSGTKTDPDLLESGINIPSIVTVSNGYDANDDASDVASQLRWQRTDEQWLQADLVFDHKENRLNQAHLGWHYRRDNRTLYNLGYSQRRLVVLEADDRRELKQLDASLSFPLGTQWQLYGRWNYDLEDSRPIEALFGVSYESCCWVVRSVYQHALEPDDQSLSKDLGYSDAVMLEFQLKGLGGLGNKIGSALEESIFGYRDD